MFVFLIAGSFFALQFCLMASCVRFLREVGRSIQRRGSSTGPASLPPRSDDWLAWVDRAFDAQGGSSPGWTRDDAFEMLDERIAALQRYQWLQRLGVMAPLLGVLITATGLLNLRVPADEALTISSILAVISPLFSGVIAGASLAIANQVFLQVVQRQVEGVRADARGWFDRSVWPRANAGPREAVDATVRALRECAESVRHSGQVQQANARRTRRATRAIVRAAFASERAFQGFKAGLAGFSTDLATLQKATESTRRLAESMEPSFREVHETLKASADSFREAVVDRFVPSAVRHDEASKSARDASATTAAVMAGIETLTQQVLDQVKLLTGGTRDLGETGAALRESVRGSLLPAHEALRQASTALGQAAGSVPAQFEASSSAFALTANQLRQTLKEDLAPAASDLHESIKGVLRPTIERHQAVAAEAGRAFEGVKALFDQVQNASRSLEERYGRLAEAASRQAQAGEEVMEAWRRRLLPAQDALADSVADLSGSSKKLLEFVDQGLQPATDGLAELGQVIPRVREAADAIGAIGAINAELGRLLAVTKRLRKSVDSARSLSELEGVIDRMSLGFAKADELRQTVSEMPDLFARQLHAMSNDAFRRQAGDLKETLYDIVKQFGWHAPRDNGKTESSR